MSTACSAPTPPKRRSSRRCAMAEQHGINTVFETGGDFVERYNRDYGGHMQFIPHIEVQHAAEPARAADRPHQAAGRHRRRGPLRLGRLVRHADPRRPGRRARPGRRDGQEARPARGRGRPFAAGADAVREGRRAVRLLRQDAAQRRLLLGHAQGAAQGVHLARRAARAGTTTCGASTRRRPSRS